MSMSLKSKIHHLLDPNNEDLPIKCVDVFLIGLICLNIIAVIFETVQSVNVTYHIYFHYFEIFSISIFTIEYFLRLWSCTETKTYSLRSNKAKNQTYFQYFISPMAIIDLIAILPFYLSFIFNVDLRFLRILRMLRIFKLTRYSESMTMLLNVLHREKYALSSSFFILMIIMIIAASGIYLIEHSHQPEHFQSIPHTMWWAIVTLTTVGYGDVYPITTIGKLFASSIMIAGIGFVALPTAILASSFSNTLKQSRKLLKEELIAALEDGVISEDEDIQINRIRKKLGMSIEEVETIKHSLINQRNLESKSPTTCPHCHKKL